MLSLGTQTKLAEFIAVIADHERVVRNRQEKLLEELSFSPYCVFGALDKYRVGYLVPLDLMNFLKEFGYSTTLHETEQLIESFGSKGRLYNEDLIKLILPRDPSTRSIMLKRESDTGRALAKSILITIASIIQAEIDGISIFKKHRDILTWSYDYNITDVFHAIDKYSTGYVTSSNLAAFLILSGVKVNEANLFIERLDEDMDGRLSFSEFSNGLMSRSKHSYSEKATSPITEHNSFYESPQRSAEKYSSAYKLSPFKLSYNDYQKKGVYVEKKLEYELSPPKNKKIASELAFAMEEQISCHKRFNLIKEELVNQEDFNLTDGFRLLDTNGKGFVTLPEFREGLKDIGVNVSGNGPTLLFKRMDHDSDARVRFSDFCSTFASKDKKARVILEARQPYYMHHLVEKDVYFSANTRDIFKQAFEALLLQEQSLEIVKQRLRKSMSFNVYEGFNAIDPSKKGQIAPEMVRLKCKE
jgi:Ca2+-binding EF-hand superfamily protein